jgi:oligopeptide transport system substrate-binding protein
MSWSQRIDRSRASAGKALLAAGAALLLLTGCQDKGPARPPCAAGKVCLQVGNTTEPATLDPHKATGVWEDRILSSLLVGLTESGPDGKPVPGMAERWETSPDGLTWTFHLRRAQWSDGVPVTSEDFVYSLRRVLLPEIASEYASLLYVIANAQAVNEGKAAPETLGVRALSPQTLEIRLEHPAPYLLELTKHNTMYPVPRHVVQRYGEAWSQPAHYVGNGAYVLKAWRLGDYVRAVKNPRFYDADKVCVDEIYFYPTGDATMAERRVARGELDFNTEIQSNRIAYLQKTMPGYPRIATYLGVSYLAFNARVPAFRDARVRTALSMAIDREFITGKLMRGGQAPAYTFVPPGVASYAPPAPPAWSAWPFERRQAEARRLLAAAGYGPSRPLKFEIKHRASADPVLIMPAIQADWKAIGVQANLVQNETQVAYAAYRARDFDVADASWIADYNDPMSFLYLLQSKTGPQNYGDYANPRFDALLAQADAEPDAGRRAEHLRQAEQMMLGEGAIAPVYFYVSKNLVSPRVTGWVDNIVDHHRIRYLCMPGTR